MIVVKFFLMVLLFSTSSMAEVGTAPNQQNAPAAKKRQNPFNMIFLRTTKKPRTQRTPKKNKPNPRAQVQEETTKNLSILTYDTEDQAPRSCNNFINARGELGVWGKRLIKATYDVNKTCFYEQINYSGVCPQFNNFSQFRKEQFIAFLFASIAAFESSCNNEISVQGTNDLADGIFQLEYSQAQRADAQRSARFCASNRGVNTRDINFQMECAASIFSSHYCKEGRIVGARTGGYFQKLNRPERAITQLARRFPYCN